MDLPFPKTLESDYISFQKDLLKLNQGVIKNQISKEDAQKAYELLLRDYKGKLFEEDLFYFDSLDDLIKALELNGVDKKNIVECAKHENLHAQAAIKLGYNVSYSCVRSYCKIGEELVIKIFPRVGVSNGNGLNPESLIAIINAVDNPSPLDIEAALDISLN